MSKKKVNHLLNIPTPLLLVQAQFMNKQLLLPVARKGTTIQHLLQIFLMKLKTKKKRQVASWKTKEGNFQLDYLVQKSTSFDQVMGALIQLQPIYKRPKPKRFGLKDFQVLCCLGQGAFSKVYLARNLWNGQFYALKIIPKSMVSNNGKQSLIENERRAMTAVTSEFLIRLYCCFESRSMFVFVLEYCSGGQLFYLIKGANGFSQEFARFYVFETLLALDSLHKASMVYRDLKPQNILITHQGHVKLSDFGFIKSGLRRNQRTYSFVGSPQYMAPEMLKEEGHGFTLDFYCLGALCHELVLGLPPFYSKNKANIAYDIKNKPLHLNDQVSLQLKDFLQSLLTKDPTQRLGSQFGIDQILNHPWLRNQKAEEYLSKRVRPPFVPSLLNLNIDEDQIEEDSMARLQEILEDPKEHADFEQSFPKFYYQSWK